MTLVELWLRAFVVTAAVELAVGGPLLAAPHSRARRAAAVLFANLASHPVLWFVLLRVGWPYELRHLVGEAWAIGVEAGIYKLVFPTLTWRRVAAVSLLANGASLAVGLGLRALGVAV